LNHQLSRAQSNPELVASKTFSELAGQVQELSGLSNQLVEDKKSIRVSYRMNEMSRRKVSSRSSTAWATKLATRWEFEALIAISICANAVTLGWNSDWSMKNPGSQRPVSFAVLDLTFLCIFILELVLRMIGEGCAFFHYRAKMFSWNVFDTVVISLTLLNEINVLGADASVVRVFRVLRLVYVVRVVRMMRWFLELRMLVDGIMNCGKTLLWSALILVVVTYVYAIVCLQVCSEWLSQSAGGPSETAEFLGVNFPSLVHSVYTLFKAVTGGVDWGEVSDPLQNVSTVLVLTFPIFMIVTVFCVLNVITAAFVEAAARKSQEDEATALEHIAERKKWIKAISEIFDRHNKDASGSLGWEEFQEVVADWRTRTAFMDIGIDMSFQQAKIMFRLFDWNGDGRIDINEFAQGVHHLRGCARSLDVFRHFMKLSKQLERITRMLRQDRPDGRSSGGGYSSCGAARGFSSEVSQETSATFSEAD
jgi:voltage-gated sodium channel